MKIILTILILFILGTIIGLSVAIYRLGWPKFVEEVIHFAIILRRLKWRLLLRHLGMVALVICTLGFILNYLPSTVCFGWRCLKENADYFLGYNHVVTELHKERDNHYALSKELDRKENEKQALLKQSEEWQKAFQTAELSADKSTIRQTELEDNLRSSQHVADNLRGEKTKLQQSLVQKDKDIAEVNRKLVEKEGEIERLAKKDAEKRQSELAQNGESHWWSDWFNKETKNESAKVSPSSPPTVTAIPPSLPSDPVSNIDETELIQASVKNARLKLALIEKTLREKGYSD